MATNYLPYIPLQISKFEWDGISTQSNCSYAIPYTVSLLIDDEIENELDLGLCCANHIVSYNRVWDVQYYQVKSIVERGDVFNVPRSVIDVMSFWDWIRSNPAQIAKESVYITPNSITWNDDLSGSSKYNYSYSTPQHIPLQPLPSTSSIFYLDYKYEIDSGK